MGFNPFQERGIPAEKQIRSWNELNSISYDKREVHPYTRCRIILMNGIEVEGAMFSHQFARHTDDLELKRKLALTRRIEQQQQKAVNWMPPPDESTLEVTIGYEQVAVDLTAWLARHEPDPYVKAALDFALLEDFDHLYRYANLLEMTEGRKAEEIVGRLTEITVGRPTVLEHRHPFDEVRRHVDRKKADPRTLLNIMTIVAGEQQTMNFYMNIGGRPQEKVGRGLYLEIGQIEEQHVTHYESLMDPNASWFENLLLHEYNECWLYYSFMQQEEHPQVKKMWQLHLEMELEHLRLAGELMEQFEKKDPTAMLPKEFPEILRYETNVDYVRQVMVREAHYNALGNEFVPGEEVPEGGRFFRYQELVNAGEVPSEQVIEMQIEKKGKEYRQELKGPHPVEEYRARQ